MSESTGRGAILVRHEGFLTSKRNTLVFSISAIILELFHKGEPIQPSFLEGSISVPPQILSLILCLASLYHFVRFLIERDVLIRTNSDLVSEWKSITSEARLAREQDIIDRAAANADNLSLDFINQSKLQGLSLKEAKKSIDYVYSRIDLIGKILSYEEPENTWVKPKPELDESDTKRINDALVNVGYHSAKLKNAVDACETFRKRMSDTSESGKIATYLGRNYKEIRKIAKSFDRIDRGSVAIYDVGLTSLIFMLAIVSLTFDLVTGKPTSCAFGLEHRYPSLAISCESSLGRLFIVPKPKKDCCDRTN